MPKNRKRPGSRKFEQRLLIFCEGAKNKSESAYFKALIRDFVFPGKKIDVKVIDTEINTGKELVNFAKNYREDENDILWVVYDKDGYTMHPQTFDTAKANDINIAFSSISFEVWILLHFVYTTRAFEKSEDIIKVLKNDYDFNYSKAEREIYKLTKNKIQDAIDHSIRVQKYQIKGHPQNTKTYNFNPYTNINELIESIELLLES